MNKYWRSAGLYVLIFIVIFAIVSFSGQGIVPQEKEVVVYTYSDLLTSLRKDDVKSISITKATEVSDYGMAEAVLDDGTKISVNLPSVTAFMQEINDLPMEGSDLEIISAEAQKQSLLSAMLPTLILMGIMVVIMVVLFGRMQGGGGKMASFGKSRAKMNLDENNKVTFDNVAGCDEEKAELEELVHFLKNPKKFTDLGARIPKGVLLVGPPGTGKTLLAKAVAGEANVPFFSISGSDFVEMFVGVGASRVRDLFDQAKKNAPSIVFIDEIDAVGRRRGAGLGGGHDEREQTLNQLLVEMDGFGINESVIIIAATNRADILDPALLRPGRFDRQVYVGRPDVKGREAILRVHSKGKPMAPEVDLKVVAQTTAGFTGADLANLLNEAALLSARDGKKAIDMEEIQKALIKIGVGTEKKTRVISEKEKYITAYHESGHAILFEVLSELDPVHSISIIPTGMAGGYTMPLPGEDKMYMTKLFMEQEIVSLLGGRAAEALVIKDITTGASNDIERATAMARSMVTQYGMSDILGPIQFGDDSNEVFIGRDWGHTRNYSEAVATTIDEEVKRIVTKGYNEALQILRDNMEVLHASAKLLVEKEKVTGEEFRQLFDPSVRANILGLTVEEEEAPSAQTQEEDHQTEM
ncbi:ATP-dependent metallopeptidase FtsH/Yme1/Tma family protein [Anaerotignum lactatifermentans]|uniref:ATP-dependent zinc metalloprotease FtsH n=1 Tax=Anaerotignum lactatifermentans TaxID=160404 RepID=A0ABS2GB84_9FIRM|nr:ATP-dependent metallopeptidase FtsH/Yme1/Tma family protein [Anaerotignum lactatifermentans]MBM6878043.1 ATP-dependent metallopeptidase FtsH/Yme1/Tma family protein [Anaerotignum lactatifermentans]MBM6951127.1 ATP-dependent metallopeptidase FtsH/Yme1/Tma family protein [Anaerotignum lactatifermentans]